MSSVRRLSRPLLLFAVAALLLAGGATAAVFAVHTITLKAGKCRTVSKRLRVCAAAAASGGGGGGVKTITQVSTKTITVSPSPIGKSYQGQGDQQVVNLDPFTLTKGANLNWTESLPDGANGDCFEVDDDQGNDIADNGADCTIGSGTQFLAPGTYSLTVTADAPWTVTF